MVYNAYMPKPMPEILHEAFLKDALVQVNGDTHGIRCRIGDALPCPYRIDLTGPPKVLEGGK